jgi:hypothetical protein
MFPPTSKKDNVLIFSLLIFSTFGCTSSTKTTKLKFEAVNSSAYSPNDDYRQSLSEWKRYYQHCTNEPLFADAFNLQLQDKVYIGSINNRTGIDINKGIILLDTSRHFLNVFKLLSIQNAFNCYDTIELTGNLKSSFYNEVIEGLNASPGYTSLTTKIDSSQMKIRVNTLYTIGLVPDKLIELFNTTKDTSLIHFKELLLQPGNVLLAQTVEILGFSADFPIKSKLSSTQQAELTNGLHFNLKNQADNANLILLANDNLRIQLNKRYTVLGKFLQLMSNE